MEWVEAQWEDNHHLWALAEDQCLVSSVLWAVSPHLWEAKVLLWEDNLHQWVEVAAQWVVSHLQWAVEEAPWEARQHLWAAKVNLQVAKVHQWAVVAAQWVEVVNNHQQAQVACQLQLNREVVVPHSQEEEVRHNQEVALLRLEEALDNHQRSQVVEVKHLHQVVAAAQLKR